MDKQLTLEWLDAICHDAILEARGGNPIPANRIGGNPAIAHYMNNVAAIHAIKPDDWGRWYPHFLNEADALRVASEQATKQEGHEDRINALESKFDELIGMLKPLLEAKEEKPARKAKAVKVAEAEVVDEEPEQEPEAPADAESDEEAAPNPAVYDDEAEAPAAVDDKEA